MTLRNENLSLKYVFREQTELKAGEQPPLLLLLHGFGSNEQDLISFAPYLDKRFFIVSPRAPFSLSFGGFAWFEIYFGAPGISINAEQFETSRQRLLKFIDEVVSSYELDAARVFLVGFSQGAMMSYSLALPEPERFAGVVAMSGRVNAEYLPPIEKSKLKKFPILVTHGLYDNVLPIQNGRQAKEFLSTLPIDLDYREYPMAHNVSEEALADVANWLTGKLNAVNQEKRQDS